MLIASAPATAKVALPEPELKVIPGEAVLQLLSEKAFQQGWDALYRACPWSTVFQSRAFVSTWYRIYHPLYLPLVVTRTEGSTLTGLLTLARDAGGQLTGAGLSQAEYQVWLAPGADDSAFIRQALAELRARYPQRGITLTYVPSAAPLDWTETDPVWQRHCFKRSANHPLLRIDKDHISRELRKKNRREKINRLKRQGELVFEKITDKERFAAVLDELAVQSDFRKGALYNKRVFQTEPVRKRFLSDLFEQNALHVTLLKLNEEIIASNVSIAGKGWVHLQGINTHAPTFSRYSPGILHFLMLCNALADEEVEVFDLTPGQVGYKDALATSYTQAHVLFIGNAKQAAARRSRHRLQEYLKSRLSGIGIREQTIRLIKLKASIWKEKARIIKAQGIRLLLRSLAPKGALRSKPVVYQVPNEVSVSAPLALRRDSLQELLHYQPKGSLLTVWEFLMEAMRRLETGQHAYTWSEGGCLMGCAWLHRGPVPQAKGLPAEAFVLEGFYFHPKARKRMQHFVAAAAGIALQEAGASPLYVLAPSRDTTLRSALKKLSKGLSPA